MSLFPCRPQSEVVYSPSRSQSRRRDAIGGITRTGDANLRRDLCQAATVMIHRRRSTWLRSWAAQVAKR
ncbi:transposase [Ochrobactrum teleogrylli]|uniref:transposase n=1 Tax=Ochrobactrum teleogrylli TaxID=2479765 RepID=UPI00384FFE21